MVKTLRTLLLAFLLGSGWIMAQQPAPCPGFPTEGTDPVLYEQQKKLWIEQHPEEYQEMVKEQSNITKPTERNRTYAPYYASLDQNQPEVAAYIEFVKNRPWPQNGFYDIIYWDDMKNLNPVRQSDIATRPDQYLILPPNTPKP